MEHIIITELKNGLYKLVPENGYILFDGRAKNIVSVAVVNKINLKYFSAKPIDE